MISKKLSLFLLELFSAQEQVSVEKIASIKDQMDWEIQFQKSFISPVIEVSFGTAADMSVIVFIYLRT